MCWLGSDAEAKGRIADKDITVYKVMVKRRIINKGWELFSPFKDMKYELYQRYESVIRPIKPLTTNIIEQGLHCYSEDCYIASTNDSNMFVFHRYVDTTSLGSYYAFGDAQYPVLCEGVIPKGTKYYINDGGEIVTEKLILERYINVDKICNKIIMKKINFD